MTEYICLTYIPKLRAVIRTEDGDKGYTMSEALSEIARLKKSGGDPDLLAALRQAVAEMAHS